MPIITLEDNNPLKLVLPSPAGNPLPLGGGCEPEIYFTVKEEINNIVV